MPARRRDTGTYGHAHRQARARLLAALRDGDPWARCGGPMMRAEAGRLHADHVGVPNVFGAGLPDALSYARCNPSHSARLGNRLRGARRQGVAVPAVVRDVPMW